MILVLDSSTLIVLGRIGGLELLRRLAGTVHIPQAVYDEVLSPETHRGDALALEEAEWITTHRITDQTAVTRLRSRLGAGEAEAIILAKELNADFVVLDDGTARRMAEAEGSRVVGLLGLVIHAKERGLIPSVRPILQRMITAGFYVGDELLRSILRTCGEEP